MKYHKQINGKQVFFNGILKIDGKQIINPTKEQLKEDGWLEYVPPTAEPYQPTYEEKVEQLIREKYTISDELAILRQRDIKEDEFREYYEFCEECKATAKADAEARANEVAG